MHPIRRIAALLLALTVASPLRAEPPQVVTDIAPVQSLVAQVMDGVAVPGLLIRPGASPHGYALRPSEARMLSRADLVIWIGAAQTPWLGEALTSLAPGAVSLPLIDSAGTLRLAPRDADDFGLGGDGDHQDDHGHDHGGEGGVDPHVWLDPENARVWLGHIGAALAEVDPGNAQIYRENARAAMARLTELEADITARLAGLSGGYLTFHDAYQYFERRFDLPAFGALSASDASDPGPARLAALRDLVARADVVCLFSEPQFNPTRAEVVARDLGLRLGSLDPVGAELEPGVALYGDLLTGLAENLAECLTR